MKKSKKTALMLAVMGLANAPYAVDMSPVGGYFGAGRAEAALSSSIVAVGEGARIITDFFNASEEEKQNMRELGGDSGVAVGNNAVVASANNEGVVGGVAIGHGAFAGDIYAGGNGAIAIGELSFSVGADSIAIGADNFQQPGRQGGVQADHNSIAIGGGALATGTSQEAHAMALGQAAEATQDEAVAIGHMAKATGRNSVALGSGTTVSESNVVGVGNRRITQVSRGVNGHDAVNVDQLTDGDWDIHVHDANIENTLVVGGDSTFNGKTTTKGNATFEKDILVKGDMKVLGDTVIVGQTHIQSDQVVDGNSHVNGDSVVDGDFTSHGDGKFDGDLVVHGNETLDKDLHVRGEATIDKDLYVKGDEYVKGNETVGGDSHVVGNVQIDKDLEVYGDSHTKGDNMVEGNSRVLGDTQLGDNKDRDKLDVYAKTNLHGDTTIGDDDHDKLTVNATSEFTADVTMDKNLHVKGESDLDGDVRMHSNAEIDKDLTVHGNETVDGNSHVKGESDLDGDVRMHSSAEIDKDLLVHGNEIVDGNSYVGGESDLEGDVRMHSNAEIDKNLNVHGDTVLDGTFFAKGAATFGDTVDIAKELNVGGDATFQKNINVKGDANIDGDIYGRSFNVGNERYIDKDGINANNHKVRNVADGEIGPNSLDAVNGRQLYHTREELSNNISSVGAQAAAMSTLEPLDWDKGDKLSVSASVGAYKDKASAAAGVFYRPDKQSMLTFKTAIGSNDNMYGIGFSKKFGEVTEEPANTIVKENVVYRISTSDDAASEVVVELTKLQEENQSYKAQNKKIMQMLAAMGQSLTALANEVVETEESPAGTGAAGAAGTVVVSNGASGVAGNADGTMLNGIAQDGTEKHWVRGEDGLYYEATIVD